MEISKVKATYFLIRKCEEMFGNPVEKGDKLIYRGNSRFPWIDAIFDIPAGTTFEIEDVIYDPAVPDYPDYINYEPGDNHYYYRVKGLEKHGRLCTTEIVALFDLKTTNEGFDSIAEQIRWILESSPIYLLQLL